MPTDDDIEQLKGHKICANCVGEVFLKGQISKKSERGTCSYCNEKAKLSSLEELSELIETAFDQHYYQTSDQPTSFDRAMMADTDESDYTWEPDGDPVVYAIEDAANIPEKAASDIQKILEDKFYDHAAGTGGEETEFSSDAYYAEKKTNVLRWQEKWTNFEHSLKTETRFFSRSASDLLTSVFNGIDTMKTWDERPLIVDAGPGTKFSEAFRARSFQLDGKLEDALERPDKHIGSPPSVAARAGRMNAHGISVFYGANNPMAAIAEIRPPVGSQVAVARFDIIRHTRLLDLTALSAVTPHGSIFDPTFIDLLERTMFLQTLSKMIATPVMPDHETFEYLATQAIADFLSTENDPPLDGIIFPSVQAADALNFVLFHNAARVEAIELPKGTKIDAKLGLWGEDGWEPNYMVTEEVPPKEEEPKNQGSLRFEAGVPLLGFDVRPPTLKIDLDSVRVHIIDSVQFSTSKHAVTRHRMCKA